MSTEVATSTNGTVPAELLERVLITGDISRLTANERLTYYEAVCKSVGLNPLTRPFDYLTLSGKTILYAKRDATDQLRSIHHVSMRIAARERLDDVYVVTASATMPDGRTDESIGAVSIGNLKGEALANAFMKAETKAKRRVTLSICGLGMLDETEVDTIPGVVVEEEPTTAATVKQLPAPDAAALACETCGVVLEEVAFRDGTRWPPAQLAGLGRRKHGRVLCITHYREANGARRRVLDEQDVAPQPEPVTPPPATFETEYAETFQDAPQPAIAKPAGLDFGPASDKQARRNTFLQRIQRQHGLSESDLLTLLGVKQLEEYFKQHSQQVPDLETLYGCLERYYADRQSFPGCAVSPSAKELFADDPPDQAVGADAGGDPAWIDQ